MDAGDQLVLVKRLGHIVVGTEAETLDLVLDAGEPRQNQDRRLHLGDAQRTQHLEAGHVRQVQVEQNDVVVIKLAEVDTLFPEVRRVHVEALGLEHQLDGLRRGAVVLNQQYAHASPSPRRTRLRSARHSRRPRKTPWDKSIRHATEQWLTKPDSPGKSFPVRILANRRKMLRKSGFFATVRFMLHIKSRHQPTP
jgi:hypothetical protein